jgi:DNA-binding MarR family transcriptional regulator
VPKSDCRTGCPHASAAGTASTDYCWTGRASDPTSTSPRIDAELTEVFSRYDLTQADFAVVVTLRRAGEPYAMPQARLMDALALTSGTISQRIERLQRRGVVERSGDPDNARITVIRLTDRGQRLFDEIAPVHLANEDRLLSALTPDQRQTLADLLRRLNADFESAISDAGAELGVRVEPAHVARRRRRSVGLPDVAGLLVADVARDSPAAAAGVEPGDVLTAWDDMPLVSSVELAVSAGAARSGQQVRLRLARGDRSRSVTVTF